MIWESVIFKSHQRKGLVHCFWLIRLLAVKPFSEIAYAYIKLKLFAYFKISH